MITIAGRELRSLFGSPLAWLMLALVQAVIAWLFLIGFEDYLQQQAQFRARGDDPGLSTFLLPRLYGPLAGILLLVAPLLSMRLIAGERRAATLALLQSAPLAERDIVLGKYLAVIAVMSAMLLLASLMPLTLWWFAPLDAGALAAGALGTWLCGAAALAIGTYCSTLARHPASAAASAMATLFLLWVMGAGSGGRELSSATVYLSLPGHLQPFLRGVLDTRDLLYFALLVGLALALSVHHLARQRRRG